jgi:predicted nuclease of predicted toxin-antitoxin system
LAQLLRDHGHVAEHVTDIGPGDAPDRDLWQYALDNGAVIVTKDEDFSLMFAMRGEAPTVVWVRIGNTRRSALLTSFEPLIARLVELVEGGQKRIELR